MIAVPRFLLMYDISHLTYLLISYFYLKYIRQTPKNFWAPPISHQIYTIILSIYDSGNLKD